MEILKKSWKVLEVEELKRVRTLFFFFFFQSEYFSYLSELIYSVCDILSLLR